jgi:GNAT superfamily N-acetyltransferase
MLTTITTRRGVELWVDEIDPAAHGEQLHREFNRILAAGEGYPQPGPIPYEAFRAYWLDAKSAVVGAWARSDAAFVGSYFLKPNGPGRVAHVANAGYFVVAEWRGKGAGESLVRESMDRARALGFDALQFNLVFETNPARALYERLGFEAVGRVPDVIDGEAVYIYWRPLT